MPLTEKESFMLKFRDLGIMGFGISSSCLLLALVMFCGETLLFAGPDVNSSLVPLRVDGYCSINSRNKCIEVGSSCADSGTAEKPKSCASGLDPTNINYCNCMATN